MKELFVTILIFSYTLVCAQNKLNQYFSAQQYAQVLELLETKDSSLQNLTMKATSEHRLGLWKEAKKTYLRILKLDNTNLKAISQLGSIYDQEYDLGKAIKYYRMLIQLDSTNSYYYKVNAKVAKKAGLLRESFQYLSYAHKLNPKDISVLIDLADLFFTNKQIEEADSMLQLAYQEDSSNIQVILNKSRIEYAQKDYARTVHLLLKTRGRLDLPPFYQKMLGYSYLQIDSFDLAIRNLERLLEKESNEYTHYYLATAHGKKGNWENAIYHYDLAIKDAISPNLFIYHANLGEIYASEKNMKEAMRHYEEAYQHKPDPKYLFFWARLADDYYREKQIAINLYNRYVKTDHYDKEWISYARKRIMYLKEYKHQAAN